MRFACDRVVSDLDDCLQGGVAGAGGILIYVELFEGFSNFLTGLLMLWRILVNCVLLSLWFDILCDIVYY